MSVAATSTAQRATEDGKTYPVLITAGLYCKDIACYTQNCSPSFLTSKSPNYLPGKSPSPPCARAMASSSSVSMSKAEASRPASSTPYRIRLPKPALDWLPGAHNQKWEATAEGYKAVQQPSNFRIHAKAAKIKAVSVIALNRGRIAFKG
jgi:hypothetical protein